MIERIVPDSVATAELYADPPELAVYPGEEDLVARSVDKRKREVVSARHCARLAMQQIGVAPAPILRGERNAPIWPSGVVGSLSHCEDYRAAVVAHSRDHRSLGIDAEPHAPLPDGVLDAVSLSAERTWLATQDDSAHWEKLLFCAKEATYKAWFPLTGRWLGFEDAHITFERGDDALTGTFRSRLLVDGATHDGDVLSEFDGRWVIDGGLVLTAIAVPG